MQVQPYVFFNGRADEAIEFYRTALGAELGMLLRFGESPDRDASKEGCAGGMSLPPGWDAKVQHAELRIGASSLLLSDGMGGEMKFDGFSLALSVADEAEAQRKFAALAAGGAVLVPLAKTFFSPAFGMVQDRFGVHWMVIVQ